MPQKLQQGSVQKVKVPLFGAYSNRNSDPDKDQRFINVFPESRKVDQLDQMRVYLKKRPGVDIQKTYSFTEGETPVDYKEARGLAYFNGYVYSVWGNELWVDEDPEDPGIDPILKASLTTDTRKVGFVFGNSATIGDYLFFTDGVSAFVIESDYTVNEIIGAGSPPTPHLASPTFLDGYIFLAVGSDIYNCDLDDPYTWDVSNFISSESFPDPIRALARQNNQIVAFNSISIEFFYDASNASGSPLNKNDSAVIQIGCFAPSCIFQGERYCFFVGQSETGGRSVWMIDGFQPKKISDEFIERIIDQETGADPVTLLSTIVGYGFRSMGHFFFLINLLDSNRTLLYDIEEKLWHEWTTTMSYGILTEEVDTFESNFCYNYAASGPSSNIYFQSAYSPCISFLSPTVNDDAFYFLYPIPHVTYYPINMLIRTNKYDMDTINRKRLHSLRLVSDYEIMYGTTDLRISYTDDDYKSFSTSRQMELNKDFPILYQLGSFRRRAFQLDCTTDYTIRFEALELVYTEDNS